MATSRIASARSFLSLRFSSSSAFRRRASENSMPLKRERHVWNVASLMPRRRQISATGSPTCCTFRMPMICSSLNRLFFIVHLLPDGP